MKTIIAALTVAMLATPVLADTAPAKPAPTDKTAPATPPAKDAKAPAAKPTTPPATNTKTPAPKTGDSKTTTPPAATK
jgi:hypothetical protein